MYQHKKKPCLKQAKGSKNIAASNLNKILVTTQQVYQVDYQ